MIGMGDDRAATLNTTFSKWQLGLPIDEKSLTFPIWAGGFGDVHPGLGLFATVSRQPLLAEKNKVP